MDQLTPRQRDVLRLLDQGRSQKQIAHDLRLAHSTVRKLTMAMRVRTNSTTTVQMVARAAAESSQK